MKKILALLLMLALSFTLVACGNIKNQNHETTVTDSSREPTETEKTEDPEELDALGDGAAQATDAQNLSIYTYRQLQYKIPSTMETSSEGDLAFGHYKYHTFVADGHHNEVQITYLEDDAYRQSLIDSSHEREVLSVNGVQYVKIEESTEERESRELTYTSYLSGNYYIQYWEIPRYNYRDTFMSMLEMMPEDGHDNSEPEELAEVIGTFADIPDDILDLVTITMPTDYGILAATVDGFVHACREKQILNSWPVEVNSASVFYDLGTIEPRQSNFRFIGIFGGTIYSFDNVTLREQMGFVTEHKFSGTNFYALGLRNGRLSIWSPHNHATLVDSDVMLVYTRDGYTFYMSTQEEVFVLNASMFGFASKPQSFVDAHHVTPVYIGNGALEVVMTVLDPWPGESASDTANRFEREYGFSLSDWEED